MKKSRLVVGPLEAEWIWTGADMILRDVGARTGIETSYGSRERFRSAASATRSA